MSSIRVKAILLSILLLCSTNNIHAQSNSDSLIFIKIYPVYESGLIEYSPDLLLLKIRPGVQLVRYYYFFNLTKQKFNSYSDLIDTLNRKFFVFQVDFDKTSEGVKADTILHCNNCFEGHLIPIQKNRGVVTNYILDRYRGNFESVKYKVISHNCNFNQGCVIIQSIKLI